MPFKSQSLKKRIILYLVIMITCLWLCVAFFSYLKIKQGAEQIMDLQLQQMAKALAEMPHFSDSELYAKPKNLNNGEAKVAPVYFQVWQDERLNISTMNVNSSIIKKTPKGFSNFVENNESWRVFYLGKKNTSGVRRIYVFAKYDDKYNFIRPLIDMFWLELFTEIVAIMLVVWYAVNKGLQPMWSVVMQITSKNHYDLDPISADRIPTEMVPVQDSINSLLARLKKSINTERDFISYAAHELKTPLAALKMQAQVALNEKNLDRKKEHIEKIVLGVARANHVVSQMLVLSRYEVGVNLDIERFDLNYLVLKVIDELSFFAQQKNIAIDILPFPSFEVWGNRNAIGVMIKNVIDNAVRYSPENSRIIIRQEVKNWHVVLSVTDEGQGILPEIRDKVFERFFRGDNQAGVEGAGLGLAIVKKIADMNNVTFTMTSNEGAKGCSFSMMFKIATV